MTDRADGAPDGPVGARSLGRRPRRVARAEVTDTVPGRLRLLVAGLQLVLLVAGAAAVVAIAHITRDVHQVTAAYAPAADRNDAALTTMLDADTGWGGYVLTRDRAFLQLYQSRVATVVPTIDTIDRTEHGVDRALVTAERAAAVAWIDWAGPIVAQPVPAVSAANARSGAALLDRFRAANSAVARALVAHRDAVQRQAMHVRNLAIPVIVVVILAAVLGAQWLRRRVASWLSTPLTALWTTVRRIDAGELTARADPDRGPVEVRSLARAVNDLGERTAREAAGEETAAELRGTGRVLREQLRRSGDPLQLMRQFVEGSGAMLGADAAWLQTIERGTVPQVALQWTTTGTPRTITGPVTTDEVSAAAQQLWEGVGVVTGRAADGTPGPAHRLAERLGATSWLAAGVADAHGPVGLVLIVCDTDRSWTDAEMQIFLALTADLGHAVVQSSVIAAQHETMAQMRAIEAAKSAFIASVSHELRTPLTSISGFLEILLDGDLGEPDPQMRQALEVIARNAARLKGLIEDLLIQSRIEAGRLELNPVPVELGPIVTGIATSLGPLAHSGQVDLHVDVAMTDPLVVAGDHQQLEQVLTNLIGNAIKFTPAGGRVEVRLGPGPIEPADEGGVAGPRVGDGGVTGPPDADGAAVVRITDSGIGIPAAELPHLFDRFFRASNAVDGAIGGTGLGLSIVQEIVQLHGGTLAIDSVEGVGTRATVRIPVLTG